MILVGILNIAAEFNGIYKKNVSDGKYYFFGDSTKQITSAETEGVSQFIVQSQTAKIIINNPGPGQNNDAKWVGICLFFAFNVYKT